MVLKNLFTGQHWRNRHRKQTYRHGERGGESEMYGKSNMENYITICKIHSRQEFPIWLRKIKLNRNLLYGSGNSVSTYKGGMQREEMGGSFKREGIYVYLWLIHVEV